MTDVVLICALRLEIERLALSIQVLGGELLRAGVTGEVLDVPDVALLLEAERREAQLEREEIERLP